MKKKARARTNPSGHRSKRNPRRSAASDVNTDAILGNFPREIARPALRALSAAGISELQDLTTLSEQELSDLHGMGPKAVTILKAALLEAGLHFRP